MEDEIPEVGVEKEAPRATGGGEWSGERKSNKSSPEQVGANAQVQIPTTKSNKPSKLQRINTIKGPERNRATSGSSGKKLEASQHTRKPEQVEDDSNRSKNQKGAKSTGHKRTDKRTVNQITLPNIIKKLEGRTMHGGRLQPRRERSST